MQVCIAYAQKSLLNAFNLSSLDVLISVWVFIYMDTKCMRAAKGLVSLCICKGLLSITIIE